MVVIWFQYLQADLDELLRLGSGLRTDLLDLTPLV